MRRLDGAAARIARAVRMGQMARIARGAGLFCAVAVLAGPANAAEPAYRYSAPITVQQPAAFVLLPLPASAYGRSLRPGLQDLRIVDAHGARVPFALLAARPNQAQEDIEQQREAVLYPLPPKPATGTAWPAPVEVLVQGERISVKRLGNATAGDTSAGAPGWLIDLGERRREDLPTRPSMQTPTQTLRLSWSGPAEFSAAFDFETSADLRNWRAGGSGQLIALASAGATTRPLTQASVVLPAGAARFVRLLWLDAAAAPLLTGARLVTTQQRSVALDAPSELQFFASPEPVGKAAPDETARRALHFDLGGALPLVQLDLLLAPGTHVAPVRIQGRTHIDEPWHELAQSVFYRLERGAVVSASPPLALQTTARYLRLVPDERAAPLDPGQTRLAVRAQLARLVFANQGQAPFTLLAGAGDAPPSALPATTLVPALDDERPHFGRADLGAWSEIAGVARRAEADQHLAALRPWALWAVLLAGVLGLGLMVWRLLRAPTQ